MSSDQELTWDPPTADERATMAWWDGLSGPNRQEWMQRAGTGRVVDAWNACLGSFPADLPALVEVGETSRGYRLYRQPNGVGGHRYWSDAIDGGVVIWDTCLASREELETAMHVEGEFERGQR